MSKSIIFLAKSFLGNFYWHFAIFSGHTESREENAKAKWTDCNLVAELAAFPPWWDRRLFQSITKFNDAAVPGLWLCRHKPYILTKVVVHLKMGHSQPLFSLFLVFFKQKVKFLQQYNEKECQSSIRCWDLNPQQLERETAPKNHYTRTPLECAF